MLVVLASRFDRSAGELVEHWSGYNVRLMTPADLSKPGWRDFSGGPPTGVRGARGAAVIDGQTVATDELTGVLVRLLIVMPEELNHVVPGDREYVAAEMMAFLVSWLSRLTCPVLNRPTPLCLAGPAWRWEKWSSVAAEFGIKVRRPQGKSSAMAADNAIQPADTRQLIVVGDRCIGSCTPSEEKCALQLALAANVALLQLDFAGDELASVNVLPSLASPVVRAAVSSYLTRITSWSIPRMGSAWRLTNGCGPRRTASH